MGSENLGNEIAVVVGMPALAAVMRSRGLFPQVVEAPAGPEIHHAMATRRELKLANNDRRTCFILRTTHEYDAVGFANRLAKTGRRVIVVANTETAVGDGVELVVVGDTPSVNDALVRLGELDSMPLILPDVDGDVLLDADAATVPSIAGPPAVAVPDEPFTDAQLVDPGELPTAAPAPDVVGPFEAVTAPTAPADPPAPDWVTRAGRGAVSDAKSAFDAVGPEPFSEEELTGSGQPRIGSEPAVPVAPGVQGYEAPPWLKGVPPAPPASTQPATSSTPADDPPPPSWLGGIPSDNPSDPAPPLLPANLGRPEWENDIPTPPPFGVISETASPMPDWATPPPPPIVPMIEDPAVPLPPPVAPTGAPTPMPPSVPTQGPTDLPPPPPGFVDGVVPVPAFVSSVDLATPSAVPLPPPVAPTGAPTPMPPSVPTQGPTDLPPPPPGFALDTPPSQATPAPWLIGNAPPPPPAEGLLAAPGGAFPPVGLGGMTSVDLEQMPEPIWSEIGQWADRSRPRRRSPGEAIKVIAFTVPKGGTGKTSSAVYSSALLATAGRRVLVIDANSQQSTMAELLVAPPSARTVKDLAGLGTVSRDSVRACITPIFDQPGRTPSTNLYALFGPNDPKDANPLLIGPQLYCETVAAIKDDFDYIVIDGPIAEIFRELIDQFILPVSDYIIMPVTPDQKTVVNSYKWLTNATTVSFAGSLAYPADQVGWFLNKFEDDIEFREQDAVASLRRQNPTEWRYLGKVPDLKSVRRAGNTRQIPDEPEYVRALGAVLYAVTGDQVLGQIQGGAARVAGNAKRGFFARRR